MRSPGASSSTRRFTEPQRLALIKLLADDDPAVWRVVRRKILSSGRQAVGWLRPHRLSEDPVTRRRVREILDCLGRQVADERFLGFCLNEGEDFDPEEAAWLLALTRYPDINVAGYRAMLDGYAADARLFLRRAAPGRESLQSLNRYLFVELGFQGSATDDGDPDNSYLNRIVDRRSGNPIGLCLIYLFMARRLQLPITGIPMPAHHFICRYQSSTETIYIDAFDRGRLLTQADCIRHLQHSNYGSIEGWLGPATARRTLLRLCSNLHRIYQRLGRKDATARFQHYIVALAK
jgi:regulator of sirC expression with transglutaminase-like and TPR domain